MVQHTAGVWCPLTAAPPRPGQGVPRAVQPQPHQVPPLQGRGLTCSRVTVLQSAVVFLPGAS